MSSETWPPPDGNPGPLPTRRLLLTGIFVAVVVGGLVLAWAIGAIAGDNTENALAPDFTVALLDGGDFNLSDHLADDGRPVLINLWASWCGPCLAEIPAISAWAEKNPGVYVLGVAVEDVESDARALAAELQPSYDLAVGDASFRSDYPSIGLPATYLIDDRGRVAEVFNGILTENTLDALIAG
jgi:thiol-disulfide isomerase/thioredoxin